MTPLYRTSNMERAVNMLAQHFRQVLVDSVYWCNTHIRFRADAVTVPVYFARVESQVVLWQNRGGVLVRWDRRLKTGAYDAMLFTECPRAIEFLDRESEEARSVVVVYEPPTWRPHEETLKERFADKTERNRRRATDALARVRQLIESSDRFTPAALARLLRAHQGTIIPPSSFPVSPSTGARVSGTVHRAP